MIGIYQLTCTENGKRYVGQSIHIERRIREHRRKPPSKMSDDVSKFGWQAFEWTVLEECTPEQLTEREDFYLITLKPEYNILGEGHTLPLETRQQIGRTLSNIWITKTPEEKAYVLTHQLTHRSQKGHHVSDSTKEKLRQANLGKKQSEETIAKRSVAMKTAMLGNRNGNTAIECIETGQLFDSVKLAALSVGVGARQITLALRGKIETSGGVHWKYVDKEKDKKFIESRRIIKESVEEKRKKICKAVRCVETGQIFESLSAAARYYGVDVANISGVLAGRHKTTGGYHWCYHEEEKK